jgi:starch synthase
MTILLASSEVHPFSKTGGLADMVGALGKALARAGQQVGIVTPLYQGIRERFPNVRLEFPLELSLGMRRVHGEVWSLNSFPGLTIYFVDQPEFYQRSGLYQRDGVDYPDNAERFIFLSKAVAEVARMVSPQPQVVHLNDWQVALSALFLRQQHVSGSSGTAPRVCMTIHNLAYQGVFAPSNFALTNLPWQFFTPDGLEFYGQMNCLKAGISFADILTTVSPSYAREITTADLGCGLDGLLRTRADSLRGILNGVDYDEWNTTNNPYLERGYCAEDLSGKAVNKLALQREFGLPENAAVPLFGSIGRMVEQKGVDIMLGALEQMLSSNIQFVQIGSGAAQYQRAFQDLARSFPDRAAVRVGFDEAVSHRIEAGCDFFLMPSRFEPCGLNQMYSLRYGTIPIVRATGGLDDTVVDPKENLQTADGIKFQEYSSQALAKAVRKAVALFEAPDVFHQFRINAMTADFSWTRTAAEFLDLYFPEGQPGGR